MLQEDLCFDDEASDLPADATAAASWEPAFDVALPLIDAPHGPEPIARGQAMARVLDTVCAVVMLALAFPFLVLVALALQIGSPGPVFFVQRRIGRGGRMFPCFKFRTMCPDGDAMLARHLAACPAARAEWQATYKLRDDPRITWFGAWARKLSLDEFPQLINVIRGEMSIVGPRPIVTAEIVRYGACFADYCAVRPGLTGLWQISGRSDTSYENRVLLDRFYVLRRSVAFDIAIIARTVPSVLIARGSY